MKKRNLLLGMALMSSTGLVAADSLYIDNIGNVGVGTQTPASSLNVLRTDGTAQALVQEQSVTAAPRKLFQIENNGPTKFSVIDTSVTPTASEWSFTNSGATGQFRISDQNSPVVEMKLFSTTGNMTLVGTLTEGSDRNNKTNINAVDYDSILEKVAQLPISSWAYKNAPDTTHVGPMAQDFHAAFGLGDTDKGIASLDSAGIALASIKALYNRLEAKEAKIAELEQKLEAQRLVQVRLERLEAVAAKLIQNQGNASIPVSYTVK